MAKWILLFFLACGSSQPPVDVGPTWNGFAFDIGEAKINTNSEKELHVTYFDGITSGRRQLGSYQQRIEKNGWELKDEKAYGGLVGLDFAKGEQKLSLMVSEQGKRVDVVLEFE